MKTLILILCLTSAIYQQRSDIQVKYDKFEDRTAVVLWEMPLAQGAIGELPSAHITRHQELRLTLIHSHSGRNTPSLSDSDKFLFSLSGESPMFYLSPPKLTLLIDEERIILSTENPLVPDRREESKRVNIHMQYQLLRKIGFAKSVEGRLGSTDFHLVESHQSAIQRFIDAITKK